MAELEAGQTIIPDPLVRTLGSYRIDATPHLTGLIRRYGW